MTSAKGSNVRNRRPALRAATIVLSILFLSFSTALGLASFGTSPRIAHAATWTQVFSDEFNGSAGTGVNTTNWLYDIGTSYGCAGCPPNWGTGEIETMTSSTNNVFHDGSGHLAIKPIRDNAGNWTSGRIETKRTDFAAPVGGAFAVEASIQQPNVSGAAAAGYWPAFWMLGAAFRGNYLNWPSIGEIDILENINGLSSEFATLHCGVSPGGPCNETTGKGSGQRACTGCQTSFHTYRMEYDRSISPEQIRWYLDGVNFFTINSNEMDATTWNNATHHGFFLILNVAIGGGFPAAFGGGPTAATVSGIPMFIDYVRVFTSTGTGSTPTPAPTSSGPTPTPPPSGNDFNQGVNGISPTQARFSFQPNGWTAEHVILHYTITGQPQQNVNMTFNSGNSRWEHTVGGLSAGQSIAYSFTYQRAGVQQDTASFSFTFGGTGATPTPTPPPANCAGVFAQNVINASSTSARPFFQPCGWTAGYVILHYTIAGQPQQNVNMTFNSGNSRWELTVNGISAGQTLTYSFTYQRDGLQNDTGSFTWIHP